MSRIWFTVGCCGYVSALMLMGYARLELHSVTFSPFSFIGFQTILFTLGIPVVLSGAIAGERDKRTWDFLLVAPITAEQIVVGKFLAAQKGITFCYLALLLGIVLMVPNAVDMDWFDFFLAETVSYSFALLVAAISIFFSARSKKALGAMGGTLGMLAVTMIGWPLLSFEGIRETTTTFMFDSLHPLYSIYRIAIQGSFFGQTGEGYPGWVWGWPQVTAYALSVPVWLYWAIKTLKFAENDVRTLPTGRLA